MSIVKMTAQQYHEDPAPGPWPSLSSSIAKILIEQSPQHAYLAHPRLNPNYVSDSDSRFDLGSAAHLMLLEKRDNMIIVVPHDDWRTNAAKKLRDDAQAAGQYAILERHHADVMEMCTKARVFLNGTELGDILDSGAAERSVLWQEGGIFCRCRPDLLSSDMKVILDYKTTGNAEPEAFGRQIGRMNYDLQASFYQRGLKSVTGLDPVFVFLAQEITPPYACSLTALSNAYEAIGEAKVKRAMSIWTKCLASGEWPGYDNRIHYIEPKPWNLTVTEEWQ